MLFNLWATEWALEEKVSFNGVQKTINVNSGVTELDIRAAVYSAWVRWIKRENWPVPAMRYSGADVIPGGETGLTFFLINGWKMVIDFNHVQVTGVLYSDDFATPYWSVIGDPLYPAMVSSLVNSVVSIQNVVTGTVPTVQSIAEQVRIELALELARIDRRISTRATPGDLFAAA